MHVANLGDECQDGQQCCSEDACIRSGKYDKLK